MVCKPSVAERYKTWTVFARSNAGIVRSIPTHYMDVCVRLFCVCAILSARSLATDWSLVQGVQQTMYRIFFLPRCSHTRELAPTFGS
jgi:hypothetical protein